MNRNPHIIASVLAIALTLNGKAQSDKSTTPADTAARARVAALSAVFRFDGTELPSERASRMAAMPDATDKVRAAIDEFVQRSLAAQEGSQRRGAVRERSCRRHNHR